MKISDYLRLGLINIKNHKRRMINILIGLTFGVILLVPVLFLTFTYKLDIMNRYESRIYAKVNECRMSTEKEANDLYSKMYNDYNISNSVYYNRYFIDTYSKLGPGKSETNLPNIYIDGVKYTDAPAMPIEAYDFKKTTSIFLEDDDRFIDTLNNKNILAGSMDFKNPNDIVISSYLCHYLDLGYEEVIGKKISYELFLTYNSNNNDISLYNKSFYAFKDFNIIGVANLKYRDSITEGKYMFFWIDEDSIKSKEAVNVDNYEKLSNNSGGVYLPYNYGCHYEGTELVFETNNFLDSIKIHEYFLENEMYTRSLDNGTKNVFNDFYDMYNYISTLLTIVSILVIITTIFNLYNSVKYSANKKKHYSGMLEAIGMTKKQNLLINIIENLFICIISSIIVFITSFFICQILVNGYNSNIMYDEGTKFDLSLNLSYYPLSILICIVGLIVMVLLITIIANRSINRKNMIELLNDEI